MSDNYVATKAVGGIDVRTIDKSGKETQVVIVDIGGSGGEVLTSGTMPISGSVDTELPFPVVLNGTIVKSVSAPVLGKALLVSDNTNFIQPLGDSANGVDIDVTRLSSIIAGSNYIGVRGISSSYSEITPTLTVAGAYTSGNYVGTSATVSNFSPNVLSVSNSTGIILSATLIDRSLQSAILELWLFDSDVTPPNDNSAWTISDADSAKCIGIIKFINYYVSALNSISNISNVNLKFKTKAAVSTLKACLVTRGTPTYSSGDLTVRLSVLQD